MPLFMNRMTRIFLFLRAFSDCLDLKARVCRPAPNERQIFFWAHSLSADGRRLLNRGACHAPLRWICWGADYPDCLDFFNSCCVISGMLCEHNVGGKKGHRPADLRQTSPSLLHRRDHDPYHGIFLSRGERDHHHAVSVLHKIPDL